MATEVDEFDLERLRAEIQQEKQMREMLDQSSAELKLTVQELEKRFDTIDDEGNEWKTRYETQVEMNQQLEKQVLVLQEKADEARKTLKEGKTAKDPSRQAVSLKQGDDFNDANPHTVKQMEREKQSLNSQLRDLEWRLDQESKAYHKANDERKQYVTEINMAKYQVEHIKKAGYKEGEQSPRNIPSDRRILDPQKGPIKKTAAVKSLPKLDSEQ
ncbi:coiled-coil domain-containing protein 169-like [Lingula anatina]|uniref:Coiled-coil domain-containing protein 169 n=1 Tax=Lingula anatina TaxID=7574 RepID=A0A1S3I1X8_LINAN|nr:coiled-coil domain-containing protein 169 [Lingula anatina]XP_013392272.1 coiled-coil domain-containing protein 169-like [Lingula anatina]|eukprot:XP_013388888.1 coiled-coil domain-containing protein 169 [Lingula anatina]